MREILRVGLENEMDLILAHKRTMKLCELTGFSLVSQTLIATAVSEISRCAIDFGTSATLRLGIDDASGGKRFLKAVICDTTDFTPQCAEAYSYAKRLVGSIETSITPGEIQIIIKQQVAFGGTLTDNKIRSFIDYFVKEPPLSAYDELRRKNALLKELAEKLKESESDYRILTDSLPLMMFSVNSNGIITYTNRWLREFLGTIPKELNGDSWANCVHPSDLQGFRRDIANAIGKQIPFRGQYRLKEKSSANYVWHMISVLPLKNESASVIRWIGFVVDTNAQKQAEQTLSDNRQLKEMQKQLVSNQNELQQKITLLNRSNHELEQFAHLASHDLQEPLRKIFFYSDALRTKFAGLVDATAQGFLTNIALAAGRMKALINDLLSYSQLQEQDIPFGKVDLNRIMQEVIVELELNIKEKNAKVNISVLPEIEGNAVLLRQLFVNLFSNSLKYSSNNASPQIDVTSSFDDKSIKIWVQDNGIGFDEQHSERIFKLFERLHTKDHFPGTGIGLSICRKITDIHNGQITAQSKPQQYTVFEITLPINQQHNH